MKKKQNQVRELRAILVGVGVFAFASLATTTTTQAQTELDTIAAGDAAPGDNFGNAVAISGDTGIVGARLEGTSPGEPNDAGAAYVFVNSGGWSQEAKLIVTPSGDRNVNDQFGFSVAIDGDWAVVGAPSDTQLGISRGAAYVFQRSLGAWTQQAKLFDLLGASGDRFGDSVAIEGNRIVVGASQLSSGSGKVYVFENGLLGWTQTALLSPLALQTGDQFGIDVDLSGDTIVVGARLDDGPTNGVVQSGAAYVFVQDGLLQIWSLQQTLRASDAGVGDQFGFSVAIKNDRMAIGAPFDDGATGALYVFDRSGSTWSESAKVRSSSTVTGDQLGESVDVDGDVLIGGARAGFLQAGYVAIFQRSGASWLEDTLTSPSSPLFGNGGDQFGTSVALEGTLVLGGAPGNDDGGPVGDNRGSATFYAVDPLPSTGDTDGDGLSDALELAIANGGPCPDPNNADTDGDGLNDGYENANGPNTCDPDSDDDGLNDGDEVNNHGTDPTVADSDGDTLSDGAEVNTYNTDPLDADSDDDTIGDGVEVGLGMNPNNTDSDGDGLSDTTEFPGGCPHPTSADSDGDGLNDGMETGAGWDPCDADTDGDTLSDGAEVNIHQTDPNDTDSDDDNLDDGEEIGMGGGLGVCPDPNDSDSDNDGVLDGNEMVGSCGPCDADSDSDGLCNNAETTEGTNPADPDSDDDGLLDGAEIATNCTDPLDADSDGDTLNDGAETTAGTNPCLMDSDGDTLPDNTDPQPTIPNVTPTVLASMTLATAGSVFDTPTSEFVGPNNSVRQARRAILTAQLALAAIAINNGNYNAARALLLLSAARVDGASPPSDWMVAGSARSQIHGDIQTLLILLDLIDD